MVERKQTAIASETWIPTTVCRTLQWSATDAGNWETNYWEFPQTFNFQLYMQLAEAGKGLPAYRTALLCLHLSFLGQGLTEVCCSQEERATSQQDDYVGLLHKPGELSSIPQNPRKLRRTEYTPLSWLLTSTCILWHMCPHISCLHTIIIIVIIVIFLKPVGKPNQTSALQTFHEVYRFLYLVNTTIKAWGSILHPPPRQSKSCGLARHSLGNREEHRLPLTII